MNDFSRTGNDPDELDEKHRQCTAKLFSPNPSTPMRRGHREPLLEVGGEAPIGPPMRCSTVGIPTQGQKNHVHIRQMNGQPFFRLATCEQVLASSCVIPHIFFRLVLHMVRFLLAKLDRTGAKRNFQARHHGPVDDFCIGTWLTFAVPFIERRERKKSLPETHLNI